MYNEIREGLIKIVESECKGEKREELIEYIKKCSEEEIDEFMKILVKRLKNEKTK